VVVNLGTNDYLRYRPWHVAAFNTTYLQLVTDAAQA
jgi:hypothetical protein